MKKQRTTLIAMMLVLLLSLTACGGQTVALQGAVETIPNSAENLAAAAAEAENSLTTQPEPETEAPTEGPAEQAGSEAEAVPASEAPAAQTTMPAAAQGTQSGFSQPVIAVTPQQNTQTSGGAASGNKDEKKGDIYEAVRLINLERKKMGLKELEISDTLMEAAAIRAKEQKESFGHTHPDGKPY